MTLVLPKLLRMTLVSFVIASVVGSVVGWIATLIWRGKNLSDLSDSPNPRGWLIKPAIFGSFIGMVLIGLLPIEANPASLVGGPYSGLWFLMMFVFLAPLGSIAGAVIGATLGTKQFSQIKREKLIGIVLLLTYFFATVVLYVGLAPPALVMEKPTGNDPFPVVGELKGYESGPKDLALSDNGQQLAVVTVRYGEDKVEIWDLPRKKVLYSFKTKPNSSVTLKDILSSLEFSKDGQQLITAAVQQVQVRDLTNGAVQMRLEGGELAYPIADNKLVTLASVDAWANEPEPHNIKVWDLDTGKLLQTINADLAPTERFSVPIAISPDGRLVAFPPGLYSDRIEIWDIGNQKQVTALTSNQPAGVLSLAFSPDGEQLAVALGQGAPLSVWDWRSPKQVKTIAKADRAEVLYWTEQGIFVGSDGAFQVWDPQTGEARQKLDLQPTEERAKSDLRFPLGPSALSADRTTLAVYIPQQGIRVWRVEVAPKKRTGEKALN
ncbi:MULTISPECIES: WD40 repeat domain-containing protein [unclassified Synechocystis]|nr:MULTISPECIES: WD40 repeat domain-containing protein [unclassified Synechocystis]UOO10816.1 WD40 repeat domain-containing protein [Synechocystis sp. PCC 6803]